MSYPKMCSAVFAAVAAGVVLVVASAASATVLCKTETSPCGSRYGAGTEISGHLRSGTRSLIEEVPLTEVEFIIQCEESNLKFKTNNEGGATQTVTAVTEAFTFGSCTEFSFETLYKIPVAVLKKPSLELHWQSGWNASITAKGIETTLTYFGQDCVYGVPGGGSIGIGTLWGTKVARVLLSMQLARLSGFGCPEKTSWKAEYEVTSPSPLYAAAS